MSTQRDARSFFVSFIIVCIGSAFAPALFFGYTLLGILGFIFLGIGISGILYVIYDVRRKALMLKRTNPEAFESLRTEAKKRAERQRALEVRLTDFPSWIIVLLGAVVVVGFLGEIGFFQFNGFLETILFVLIVLFLAYYLLLKRKIRSKKKQAAEKSNSYYSSVDLSGKTAKEMLVTQP